MHKRSTNGLGGGLGLRPLLTSLLLPDVERHAAAEGVLREPPPGERSHACAAAQCLPSECTSYRAMYVWPPGRCRATQAHAADQEAAPREQERNLRAEREEGWPSRERGCGSRCRWGSCRTLPCLQGRCGVVGLDSGHMHGRCMAGYTGKPHTPSLISLGAHCCPPGSSVVVQARTRSSTDFAPLALPCPSFALQSTGKPRLQRHTCRAALCTHSATVAVMHVAHTRSTAE